MYFSLINLLKYKILNKSVDSECKGWLQNIKLLIKYKQGSYLTHIVLYKKW